MKNILPTWFKALDFKPVLLFLALYYFGGNVVYAQSYCSILPNWLKPITLVQFSNINNPSSSSTSGGSYQEYVTIIGNVERGGQYPITLKCNTDGNYTGYLMVFIDWNQNGALDDAGEVYNIGTITNSTGIDNKQVSGNILIPVTALLGHTRMRVVYSNIQSYNIIPCGSTVGAGEAEDYTLNILPVSCGNAAALVNGVTTLSGMCVGTVATLAFQDSDDNAQSYTYSWTGPNGFTSTQKNPNISNPTIAANGIYTFTVAGAGSCGSITTVNAFNESRDNGYASSC